MRDDVLRRKKIRIVIELSKLLSIGEDRAYELFGSSETCRLLSNPKYGLHLMSDGYIMDDLLAELRGRPIASLMNSTNRVWPSEMSCTSVKHVGV